eukprot:scaffold6360_cov66-Phaeocystis_antarctica.AAC.6
MALSMLSSSLSFNAGAAPKMASRSAVSMQLAPSVGESTWAPTRAVERLRLVFGRGPLLDGYQGGRRGCC